MSILRSAAARDRRNAPRDDRELTDESSTDGLRVKGQQLLAVGATENHKAYGPAGHDTPAEERVTSRQYRLWKRCMDVSLILLTSPLLIMALITVAVAVRLTSRGPVFYRHQRIGRHGCPFTMFKFRTMKVNADQVLMEHLRANPSAFAEWKLRHKLRKDPRLTSCGRFFRKTSLDELPQLWNVLRGDMSLVGPRPIVWAEKAKYGDRFHFYTAVTPGLTGLWQVSGRSDISYSARVALDEIYVRQWSLLRDLEILLKTPGAVFRCEGAY